MAEREMRTGPRPDALPRRSTASAPRSPVAASGLAGDPTLAGMSIDAAGKVHDVVIVGAGIAGLACARELRAAGCEVLVLDKSRGVGGRCTTRRMLGQPVDLGLSYYHADDPDLLAELAAVPATALPGWPHRVAGSGAPCHPAAFRPGQQRLAFAEGVNVFPRHLAQGLDMQLGTRVMRIDPMPSHVTLELEDGPPLRTRDVVLTCPTPQAGAILPNVQGRSLRAVQALLAQVVVHPCVTLILGFPLDGAAPDFDVLYPGDSDLIQLISHDSAKREDPSYRVLVVQANAPWSHAHLEHSPDHWRAALTGEAARLCGAWVREPAWSELHRWRYAKTMPSTEMSTPQVFGLPGGGQLGLGNEAFTSEAGVQGAYLAGRKLAQKLLTGQGARED